ncbi:MAG: hypothetical protein PVI06_20175, partial [Desulfobacterales bacterium]
MSYVTFKIIETQSGEFILLLHNHSRKIIYQEFRSNNFDEVVEQLKEKIAYRKHFMSALNNYTTVLNIMDELTEKYPDGEEFPEDWDDPLDLYGGYIEELKTPDIDLNLERRSILGLIEEHNAQWVWDQRKSL